MRNEKSRRMRRLICNNTIYFTSRAENILLNYYNLLKELCLWDGLHLRKYRPLQYSYNAHLAEKFLAAITIRDFAFI